MKRRYRWLIGIMLVVVMILAGALFTIRMLTYGPLSQNMAILALDHVEDIGTAVILHPESEPKATILFYPGGFVEPESYLLLANALSLKDYRVIVVRMPINLAILGIHRAQDYLEYVEGPLLLAGHSLGGASAAFFVDRHPELVDGLILMAAYPADSLSLVELPLAVLSIQASEDEILNQEAFEATRDNLPSRTTFVMIDGGNHAGFGAYGAQRGDGEATLSRSEQHALILEAIETWFSQEFGGSS